RIRQQTKDVSNILILQNSDTAASRASPRHHRYGSSSRCRRCLPISANCILLTAIIAASPPSLKSYKLILLSVTAGIGQLATMSRRINLTIRLFIPRNFSSL
ncbi:hypothetical protein PRIPAC_81074, partial [Pristionchus pacificus]|uniref:Uncharacterized protein n=1 Tax=Pristionchus pacificus TaxID=54126 RepID=A0A2A6CM86_PRIPA